MPAILTFNYLKFINQSESPQAINAKSLIEQRYADILEFRQENGAFNMWKKSSDSIWLTALIVQILSDARDIINVDEAVITQAIDYIISKQNKDGSFNKTSTGPYEKILKPNPTTRTNYLTSFVLLALQKNVDSNENVTKSMELAEGFLIDDVKNSKVDYDRAIAAYALSLANKISESEQLIFHNFTHNYRKNLKEKEGFFIEIASYETLAHLSLDNIPRALESVKWLISHRVKNGGFPSSHDNYVALKAISEFILRSNATTQYTNINLKLQDKSNTIKVNNILDTNYLEVTNLKNENLNFHVNGHGFAYANLWYQYNLDSSPGKNNFNIETQLSESLHQKELKVILNSTSSANSKFINIEISLPSNFNYKSHNNATNIEVS